MELIWIAWPTLVVIAWIACLIIERTWGE